MKDDDLKRCLDNAYDHIQHECYNDALSSILEAMDCIGWIKAAERLPDGDDFICYIPLKDSYFMQVCNVNEDGDLINTDTGDTWGYGFNEITLWQESPSFDVYRGKRLSRCTVLVPEEKEDVLTHYAQCLRDSV